MVCLSRSLGKLPGEHYALAGGAIAAIECPVTQDEWRGQWSLFRSFGEAGDTLADSFRLPRLGERSSLRHCLRRQRGARVVYVWAESYSDLLALLRDAAYDLPLAARRRAEWHADFLRGAIRELAEARSAAV